MMACDIFFVFFGIFNNRLTRGSAVLTKKNKMPVFSRSVKFRNFPDDSIKVHPKPVPEPVPTQKTKLENVTLNKNTYGHYMTGFHPPDHLVWVSVLVHKANMHSLQTVFNAATDNAKHAGYPSSFRSVEDVISLIIDNDYIHDPNKNKVLTDDERENQRLLKTGFTSRYMAKLYDADEALCVTADSGRTFTVR